MPTAKADWQAMLAMVNQVNTTADNISSSLNTLQSELETLAPQWQSDAASAFVQTRMLWDEDARKLHTALVDIATGLQTTATNYQRADQAAGEGTRAR